jgi:hypothetical protein
VTLTIGDWLGIGGLALTLAGGLGGVVRWAIKRETEYVRQAELDRLENRLNTRVDQLDKHVETMTAMWVAKGKD